MQAMEHNSSKSRGAGLIERIIKRYIEDNRVVFVFPTEIAADMWQERALDFHPCAVLPDERFLPWDRFKSIHAAKAETGKAEIHERMRALYAENLAERNASAAKKGKPLLQFAIPPEFAESASLFSSWIASVLPHLALFEERRERFGTAAQLADAEDRDIAFIFEDYKAFLERSSLFEANYCRRFEVSGKKHIIFFYEAIEGFSAYAAALNPAYFSGEANDLPYAENLADFTAVSAPPFSGENAQFKQHADFREEFRQVALKIESLFMRGESADTIAVSISNAEVSEPYLIRELATRSIPTRLRFGRALAETHAGRIFPRIQQCKAEDFSFNAVKKLLSIKSIAWLSPELPASLIQFGIENRCLCSWREDGKLIDIWENAFNLAGRNTDFRIREWYLKLKKNVLALTSAKTFAAARSAWFIFRDSLLDMEKMGYNAGEGKTWENLEIGRCIKELDALVEIEKAFPELTPRNPFSFFVSRLKKTRYVPQSKMGGVSVFKYKDAAASPFKFHFITGITQEDATALHSELKFLRKDKREQLASLDEDASEPLFSSYMDGADSGGVFFSAALRGVDGYKTVHSAFNACATKDEEEPLLPDPLEMEERQERPPRAYPTQKAGFEAYSFLNADKATRFSFLKKGFEGNASDNALTLIKERIAKVQKTPARQVRVSATDLKDFSTCPAKWLMKKALKLEKREFSPELDIIDAGERGSIFHEVVEKLYKFIKEKDGAFLSSCAELYLNKAEEIIPAAMEEALGYSGMKNPLAEPASPALAARLKEGVEALINTDCALLDGFVPVMTENKLYFSAGGMEFFGIIDRISKSVGGNSTVIVDYKTGGYPTVKAYEPADGKIEDFQMPFYVFLCREALKMSVTQAWFFSVKDQKYVPILNTDDGNIEAKAFSRSKPFKSAEEFEAAIDAMRAEAAAFAEAINAASFSAKGVYTETCQACDFRAVCRRAYAVAQD